MFYRNLFDGQLDPLRLTDRIASMSARFQFARTLAC
jgi:hypothetical protein